MNIYTLHKEQFLPVTLQAAWEFFSTPMNLAKITPDDMAFEVISKFDDGYKIHKGLLIEYRVSPLFGIRMKWITEIGDVVPLKKFVDTQLKGPYALWEHTHTFVEQDGGVLMHDDVRYALPMGVLGTIAHTLVVKKKLEDIFNYREKVLEGIFK
jgi:ligand-binding SRPBCC domain-containing protein